MATDEKIPSALQPYTIRVRPNWVARISGAAVLLLLLFFAVTQYNETRSLNHRLDRAENGRVTAESDRRIANEALAQARKAQDQASKDRATALNQNNQLIEVALALEAQLSRLGIAPDVPKNSVLRLRVTPEPTSKSSATPGAFVGPRASGAGGGRPAASPTVAPGRPTGPGATPTASSTRPSTSTGPSPSSPVVADLPDLPIITITGCLPLLVCIR